MKVTLTYFKQSGKYYTTGEYETKSLLGSSNVVNMYEISDEVKAMRLAHNLPGVSHGLDFYIMIDCEQGYPVLIHPLESV